MNVGDTVKCINNKGQESRLIFGWEYLIESIDGNGTIGVRDRKGCVSHFNPYRFVLASSKPIGIYQGGLVLPVGDNGAVPVWTEEELIGQATDPDVPWAVRHDLQCDMGCHAVGETHYEACKAYDPNKQVKF